MFVYKGHRIDKMRTCVLAYRHKSYLSLSDMHIFLNHANLSAESVLKIVVLAPELGKKHKKTSNLGAETTFFCYVSAPELNDTCEGMSRAGRPRPWVSVQIVIEKYTSTQVHIKPFWDCKTDNWMILYNFIGDNFDNFFTMRYAGFAFPCGSLSCLCCPSCLIYIQHSCFFYFRRLSYMNISHLTVKKTLKCTCVLVYFFQVIIV